MVGKHHQEPESGKSSFSCVHCGALAVQYWHDVCLTENDRNGKILSVAEINNIIDDTKNDLDKAYDHQEKERIRDNLIFFNELLKKSLNGKPYLFDSSDRISVTMVDLLKISRCYNCSDLSIWINGTIVWPETNLEFEPNDDLPPDIRKDFLEAASVLAKSPRSACALLRLCLQKLLIHLKYGSNINDAIARMVKDGLPVQIQRSADIIRIVGNDSVHPGTINPDDDRKIAGSLFDLVNYVCDHFVSTPKRLEKIYSWMPEEKIKAIEARDKPKQKD